MTTRTIPIKKGSKSQKHIEAIIARYGKRATFRVDGIKWFIVGVKPRDEFRFSLVLESIL